jgi:hypothetical protein
LDFATQQALDLAFPGRAVAMAQSEPMPEKKKRNPVGLR